MDSIEDFLDELRKGNYTDETKSLLRGFEDVLLKKNSSTQERIEIILYYSQLASKDDESLLNTAMHLCIQIDQLWLVSDQTLSYLTLAKKNNKNIYNQFLEQLTYWSKEKKLFLKAHHLDTLVQSLHLQKTLPADIMTFVPSSINLEGAIRSLRSAHGHELNTLAKVNQKLHHAAPHALEIKVRTMLILNQLGIFSSENPSNDFVAQLIEFMVEFHDHEQVNRGAFNSVEEATADRILGWLSETLSLEDQQELKAFLEFVANRIIVLGTTMVFSLIQTADLSELYTALQHTLIRCGIEVMDSSNAAVIKQVDAAMMATGLSDKNPAALPLVVVSQAKDEKTCTLSLLKKYFKDRPLLIDKFFNSGRGSSYYTHSDEWSDQDKQAFFITLVPHLSMRAELSAKDNPQLIGSFIDYIVECRAMRLQLDDEGFMSWYQDSFSDPSSATTFINQLFFTAIDSELSFSRSQKEGLLFAQNWFESSRLIPEGLTELIDAEVPERDAINLYALYQYYSRLTLNEQNRLIQELIFALIVQAGAIYSHQFAVGYYKPLHRPTDNSSAYGRSLSVLSYPPIENPSEDLGYAGENESKLNFDK
jgi:hypothetical protein